MANHAADDQNFNVLAKIPLIIAGCISTQIAWSPPAQATKKEQVPPKDWIERYMNFVMPYVWVIRVTWWIVGFTEIFTILLRIFNPSSSYLPSGASNLELNPLNFIGITLLISGAAIRYACYKTLGSQFTFDISIQSKHKLISNGPYSIVRHPSYSGHVLVYTGLAIWHATKGSWLREMGVLKTVAGVAYFGPFIASLLIIIYAVLVRVPKEDGKLREIFGKEWEEYRRRVPCAIIPGVV